MQYPYQVKIRYVGPEAHTLWAWGQEFQTLEAAQEHKRLTDGTPRPADSLYPGWTREVKIFQLIEVE